MFRITNADATRNVETYKKLLLETVDKVRNVTRLTTMEFEQGVLTFFGPTPTGKTVVRKREGGKLRRILTGDLYRAKYLPSRNQMGTELIYLVSLRHPHRIRLNGEL